MVAEDINKKPNIKPVAKLRGKYSTSVGRRKTSVARIRMYKKGSGLMVVNGKKLNEYFTASQIITVRQALKLTGQLKELDFSIVVRGGGLNGQSEAIRHGLSRSLATLEEKYRPGLKAKGWLGRDARKKERKKPGLKKARRAPQWSKR